MAIRLVVVVALLLGNRALAHAQVTPGTRVRVQRTAAAPIIGFVDTLTADTLVVTPLGTASVRIPIRTIRRVEISQGVGHAGARGAAVGAGIGVVPGVVWGVVAHEQCEKDGNCFFDSPGPEVVMGAILGAGTGALIGYVVGRTQQREHWKPSPLAIEWQGAQVGLGIRF